MQIPVMRRSIEIEQLGESLNYASLELYSTERQLIEERERLAVTLVSIGDGVIVTNTEGRIVLINRVAEELTGWTSQEAEGKLLTEIFCIINEETREISENPVEKVLRDGKIVGLANHTALISRNGRERSIGDSGAPIKDKSGKIMGVALVFRDITEKNRMEAELLKTQKLESLGILAGGIAHDFNNILTVVLGNISVAKRLSNSEDEIYERLKIAEKATLKARELTQQLLIFSKGGAPVMKRGSVGNLLRETASFTLRGSNVKCDVFIPDKLWQVEMDEGQMSQVIQNLIINAQQAMPEGGLITLWAENITIENDIPNLQRGNYVMIGVEDKGSGIPEKHLPLIFDPYFTTKEKGSGLGLTIAHSIIKKHGGNITVKSKIDAGTTFYVYIPASYNNKEDVIIEKRIQEITSKGTGRILIMDDEEYIRELVTNTLTHCGYNVESASNGEEAIELYKKAKKSGHAFDAVILDITVPGGMGGKETIKKLMEIDPDVKAIVSSGYSNDAVMAEFWKHGFKGVVTKPYKVEELYEVLQGVITINDSLAKNKP
ncbi:MAG: response regulator [Nitrospirae bacterium]|nr:response regulator [Nitrospirota bacterium]